MTSVNTNMGSLLAMKNMDKQEKLMTSAMERLSSGLRINNAADDAARVCTAMYLVSGYLLHFCKQTRMIGPSP